MYRIKLCQLNLLAPMWVNEEYKVLPWYDLYVDPKRLNHTLAYLKDLDADIYCLCEVEARQLGKLDKAFPNYHRMFTSNAASFWSEWATPVHGKKAEWMPNGTCTLLNSDIYELKDHAYINLGKGNQLGEGDGCRCTIVKARHKASGYSILVATVHFDTEVKKFMEAFTLIEALKDLQSKEHFDLVLVSGDYNFTDVSSFEREGYTELVKKKRDTTPLPQGMIDHTLLLTSHKDVNFKGHVLQLHRQRNDRNAEDILRDVGATVSGNGSDHYASVIDLRFA